MTGPTIQVNGIARPFLPGATVADVVLAVIERASGCAVARNGEVVPKSSWEQVQLVDGDALEILVVAAGG